jgi:hypothetical protein
VSAEEAAMGAITIVGLNPYTVSFAPKDPQAGPDVIEVVKRWEITANAGSECLDVPVDDDPNSLLTVLFTQVLRQPDGTTRRVTVSAATPQSFKITLGCGTCTCGQAFGVKITARFEEGRQRGTLNEMSTVSRSLVKHCKGPGCPSTLLLGGIQPKLSDEFAAFVELTPDLLARLDVTVVDPAVDATGPGGGPDVA